MLYSVCLNTPKFHVLNRLSFWFFTRATHIAFLFPNQKYFSLFPRKIVLYLLAMTHPYSSKRTTSVIKTQDDQMDLDRFYTKCILAEPCKFKTRPTASTETSDIQKLKLYHGLKYDCLPIAIKTQYANP